MKANSSSLISYATIKLAALPPKHISCAQDTGFECAVVKSDNSFPWSRPVKTPSAGMQKEHHYIKKPRSFVGRRMGECISKAKSRGNGDEGR